MAKIRGLGKWNTWVDTVPVKVQNQVNDLVKETAYRIEADAKRNTPVDTGHLRRSISTVFEMTGRGYTATIGTNVEYAVYVEFGTSRQHPQPFLIPAYLRYKPLFEAQLQQIIRRIGD